MIRSFAIDNFKSLVDFSLPMPPHSLGRFVCLIGLNGAGKSTVIQALDFLGHLGGGEVSAWLERREWEPSDLTSRFLKKHLISFRLEFEFESVGTVVWEGAFNSTLRRCTSESITVNSDVVLSAKEQKLQARLLPPANQPDAPALTQTYELQNLNYQGSTMSILKSGRMADAIEAVRGSLGALKSLEMLSPQAMRQRSRKGVDIGYGGERLSGYLHAIDAPAKHRLLALLQEFYPSVEGLTTRVLRAGWSELSIAEKYVDATDKPLNTSAKQLNDGLLRILAVLAQVEIGRPTGDQSSAASSDRPVPAGCVLFDEIENGVNPELMKKLVGKLILAPQQVVVTTHSPLILNYLPTDVARESVILLYRDAFGHTKSVRFFDLPSVSRKLGLLGPGEVFVDTDLIHLPEEVEDWQRSVAEAAVRESVAGMEKAVEQATTAQRVSRSAISRARRSAGAPSGEAEE